MTDSPFKYHAFISYSYRDKAWGEWLHQALETYRIPKGIGEHVTCYEKDELPQRLYPVFRDRDELSSAHRISETVMKALGESRALIVICSPNSAGSEWVDNEISTFQRLYPERPILALVVEDSPPDCFPPSLLAEQPLAADARMEGDGKPDAILKLIGGLLGVGFGILKDREIKRKRRRMVTLVSTISAVALGFAGLTLWALKAEQQTRVALVRAEQSAEESKAVLEFFKTRVLAAARPKEQDGGLGIDATIRQAIKAAEPQIEGAFVDQPLVEASIRHDLGETYRYLGDAGAALVEHRRAFELRRSILGSEHLGTLRSMNKLAIAYRDLGRYDEMLEMSEKSLKLLGKVMGSSHPDTLSAMNNLANSFWVVGRHDEALDLHKKTLTLRKKVLGSEHPSTLNSMNNLAASYEDAGDHTEAMVLYEDTLQLRKSALGAEHPDTLQSMNNLANAYRTAGRRGEALALHQKTLDLQQKILGPQHPDTLSSMNNLAISYRDVGRNRDALALREETLGLQYKVRGGEHPFTLKAMYNLAISYRDVARRQEALALHRETLDLRKKVLGAEHPDTLKSMCGLADVYADMKLYEQALPLYEEALQVTRTAHGPDHSDTIISMGSLAYFLWKTGQLEAAETQFRELIAVREKQGQNDWALYYDQVSLGAILTQEKIYPEAEKLLLAARAGLESIGSNTGSEWEKRAMGKLVGLYQEWGKSEKASEWEGKLATALQ